MAQKLFAKDQLTLTKGAGEALGAYLFVKETTDTADVELCDSAGEAALGVTDAAWDSGDEAVKVIYAGIAYVKAGGTIAVGANVQTTAAGKALTAASGDVVLGRAMSAGDDGDLIAVLLSVASGYTIA